MLASVVFPGGYTAVDWEFRGFRQGHSSSGRWREKSCTHKLYRKRGQGKEREKETADEREREKERERGTCFLESYI